MELVDSHCHINFEPLNGRLAEVLERARDNHVAYLLCVSVNVEDFPQVLALAAEHAQVFASAGVHPNEREGKDPETAELVEWARHPLVVAVGETGLDYFRSPAQSPWQRERFRRHIDAANAVGKPLIVHSRDAAADTLAALRAHDAAAVGGVMHCFADDWPAARQALDLGLHISFSGIVTFKNAHAIQDVARRAPLDRILVETDCPYLAPMPHRGKTNEPAFVLHTAQRVAELRGMDLADLAAATTENFFRLFSHARR